MFIKKIDGPRTVRLPSGRVLTLADLPPADTTRWVASRKAVVVHAVNANMMTRAEAISRYGLSEEELLEWELSLKTRGKEGLKVTKLRCEKQS